MHLRRVLLLSLLCYCLRSSCSTAFAPPPKSNSSPKSVPRTTTTTTNRIPEGRLRRNSSSSSSSFLFLLRGEDRNHHPQSLLLPRQLPKLLSLLHGTKSPRTTSSSPEQQQQAVDSGHQETEQDDNHNTQQQQQQQQQQQPRDETNIADGVRKQQQQTVAVVGTGAVGGYYGARLHEAGHCVHFYMRNEHYEAAQTSGLHVESVEGDIHISPNALNVHNNIISMSESVKKDNNENGGGFDWVVVALKSTSLSAIPDLIIPLLSPHTRVLVIMNGMIEDDLIKMLRERTGQELNNDGAPLQCCQTLYGGMALVCSNRIAPAVIHHTYFGLLTAGVASTQSNNVQDDEQAFTNLFAQSKVDTVFEPMLLRGRWRKMLWNLPFNGLAVSMGGITVDQIVGDPGLRRLAYTIMDETIIAAHAELEDAYGPGNFEPLGDTDKQALMQLSDDMGPYKPSTMLDFLNGKAWKYSISFANHCDGPNSGMSRHRRWTRL